MATINGTTSSSSLWTFKLVVEETATSISNNTSSVKVTAYIGRTSNSGSYMYGAKISCVVGLSGVSSKKTISYSNSSQVNISAGGWLNIGSVTFTGVPHNSDGSKTVKVQASFTNNVSPSSGSASGNFTLTTIPRASSMSISGSTTLGAEQTFTISRASSSFTHSIMYVLSNGTEGVVIAGTSNTSIKWTPPLSLAKHNTTGTSVSMTFKIITFSGSTNIGTKSSSVRTYTIPDSVAPSCSLTLDDVNKIDDKYGRPVQGLSKIKITVNTTLAQNSPIASYSIWADGRTYTSNPATTGLLKDSGSSTISATVTDKRGRSGTASYTMTVIPYSKAKVSKLTVARCNQNGTANPQGEYVKVTFSAAISSINSKNTAAYTLRYKKSNATSYTNVTLTDLANVYTVSNQTYIFAASSDSSYDVQFEAKDNHGKDTKTTSVSTAFTLMNWGADGTSMGIGKVAEKANTLEVGLETDFKKSVDSACSTVAYNHTHPTTGVQVGFGVGAAGANHGVYSNTLKRWILRADGTDVYLGSHVDEYRPYYRAGDSLSIYIYTAGYLTGSGKRVDFTVSLQRPVQGNPTITVRSNQGLILRQSGYSHETGASTYVSPSNYHATLGYGGIVIQATMPNTTNSTNNAPIGIIWSGYIDFT